MDYDEGFLTSGFPNESVPPDPYLDQFAFLLNSRRYSQLHVNYRCHFCFIESFFILIKTLLGCCIHSEWFFTNHHFKHITTPQFCRRCSWQRKYITPRRRWQRWLIYRRYRWQRRWDSINHTAQNTKNQTSEIWRIPSTVNPSLNCWITNLP